MTFKVETTEIAEAQIQALFLRLNSWNPDIAGRWLEGLLRAIEGLDTFPRSHPVVRQSEQLNREVRRMPETQIPYVFCTSAMAHGAQQPKYSSQTK